MALIQRLTHRLTQIFRTPGHPARLLFPLSLKFVLAYGLTCLIVVAMELTRVFVEGAPFAEYVSDLKGRSFFTITPLLTFALIFVWGLTNRLRAAALLTALGAFALLGAHLKKMEVLEKPLVSSDFFQLREAVGILGAVFDGAWTQIALILGAILFLLALLIHVLRRPPVWPGLPTRFRIAYCALFVLAVVLELQTPWLKHVFEFQNVSTVGWNFERNLRRNGLLLSLLLDARQVVYRPAVYSREEVTRALAGIPISNSNPKLNSGDHLNSRPFVKRTRTDSLIRADKFIAGADESTNRIVLAKGSTPVASIDDATDERPDIILYLGESFWDVTDLPNVRFSRDPLPHFHRFETEPGFVHGTLLSPSFAGSTGNTEFEILTGIPLAVLPHYAVPYSNYLIRPIEALPSILQRHGYETRAIHNYYRYYYQRFSVYPYLGFQEFISLEELAPASIDGVLPTEKSNARGLEPIDPGDHAVLFDGPFPSDEPLVLDVLNRLDHPKRTDAPQFIFAISVVSHGRYQGEGFPSPDVQVLDTDLPESARHQIENYANTLFRADRALGFLIDTLKSRARPTIVAFFGDHLPSLTADTWKAAGMKWGTYEQTKYTVPCFIWSNRPLSDIDLPKDLGMNSFAPRILGAAGIRPDGYFARIESLEKSVLALGQDRLQAQPGEWFAGVNDPRLPKEVRAARDDYFLLAYDRLFGNQFSIVEGGVPEDIQELGTFEVRTQAPWELPSKKKNESNQ
ncbi:MAG: LTA synthase family protein [Myxococcales bacterium]|jgi:phosphoglycerol transferase MdoB-like AlkP superfamily enzyme|nr:LTA synthase family protein [Myxococcales bacterium]